MKPRTRECLERVGIFHNETLAWVVLAVSLVVTVLASYVTGEIIQSRAEDRFAFEVEEARHHITGRMLEYEQVLWGGVGLFKTLRGAVTRKQWHQYVDALQLQCFYPGIQGMGYALMLGPDDLASHIEEVRSEGFPDYSITPVVDRDTYITIINWYLCTCAIGGLLATICSPRQCAALLWSGPGIADGLLYRDG